MQNRIDRLENLVLSLMTNGAQSAGPSAAVEAAFGGDGNSSPTVPNHPDDVTTAVNDGSASGKDESDTEQVTKSFGILKVHNNKSYYLSEEHWAAVLNDVSVPSIHLLWHLPV